METRANAAHRIAAEKFGKQPDWMVFFREVLGVNGIVRKLFTTQEEMAEFEQSAQYAEIQQMVAKLRVKTDPAEQGKKPTRVITMRLPQSLHESLKAEAHDRRTSMLDHEQPHEQYADVDPFEFVLDTGSATKEDIAELLAEFSTLYRLTGGRGISFSVTDVREPAVAGDMT